jgi:hypothetical protein
VSEWVTFYLLTYSSILIDAHLSTCGSCLLTQSISPSLYIRDPMLQQHNPAICNVHYTHQDVNSFSSFRIITKHKISVWELPYPRPPCRERFPNSPLEKGVRGNGTDLRKKCCRKGILMTIYKGKLIHIFLTARQWALVVAWA